MTRPLTALLSLALLGGASHAGAALVNRTLTGVQIGSSIYDVTFVQDSDSRTSFNNVFGTGSPSLTFTTQADAFAAATAVRAAADALNLDVTPANDFSFTWFNAFNLPFAFTPTEFSFFSAWSDDPGFPLTPPSGFDGVFGPFTEPRTRNAQGVGEFGGSFVTFTRTGPAPVPVPVPLPGTLALLGGALAGLAVLRGRARSAP